MGRPRKLPVEADTQVVAKSDSGADFELSAKITAGSLTSNAKELRARIEAELQNYSVEKYLNDPESAKKDKAFLNKVKDSIADKRKEVSKAWNSPLDNFLEEMKGLEKSINEASSKLNDIVKEADDKEKNEKRAKIEAYFSTLDFKIVSLDRIFNPKWLNKTTKMDQVMLDIEAITEKITGELATIKSMQTEDSEILQAFYLETLDLNATLQKGNQLRANRKTIQEAEEKAKVEMVQNMAGATEVKKTVVIPEENKAFVQNESKNGVVEQPLMNFTLRLSGTREQLIALRQYIDKSGIKYEKL